MITFEVTVHYDNKPRHTAQFLAVEWADAFPQAAEIAAGNGNTDHIVDVKIDRVG